MLLPTTVLVLLFSAIISALPSKRASQTYDANFDNFAPTAASVVPVGIYDGLNYTALYVFTQGATGIKVHSAPNGAAYGVYGDTLAGSVPMLSTTGTTTKSFELFSFYFGCAANTAGTAVAAVTPCTITAVGYNTRGVQIYSKSFNFNPGPGVVTAPVVKATVNNWVGLGSVTFSTSNALGPATGTILDDLVYTVQK